jgi:hypothetical protein
LVDAQKLGNIFSQVHDRLHVRGVAIILIEVSRRLRLSGEPMTDLSKKDANSSLSHDELYSMLKLDRLARLGAFNCFTDSFLEYRPD